MAVVPVPGPPRGPSREVPAPGGVSTRPCLKWQPGRGLPSAHIPRLYAYADVISGRGRRAPGATCTRVLLLVMTDARGHPHSTCLLLGSLEWSIVCLAALVRWPVFNPLWETPDPRSCAERGPTPRGCGRCATSDVPPRHDPRTGCATVGRAFACLCS